MDNYNGESFLNRLYKDLHMSDEVMHTASSTDTKDEKVSKYLERLERVENVAKRNKYNGIQLLKEMYYKKYVIKPENVPESYFQKQKEMALDRGFGHLEITDNEKNVMISNIVEDQKKSLDVWLNYFLNNDAKYPEWFKYYAFQGMLKLGSYDKEKASFNKRTNSTTNIFVDLNREALALVYDNLCSVLEGKQVDDQILQKLLENGSFSKLYSYMLKKLDSIKKDILNSNDGVWIKYNQGSEPDELVKSLDGKGTGWCTAGLETARTQLQGGDFYVYYTKDSNDEYKQPRIAIRMEDDSIGEIRGISEQQNLEPDMEEVLNKKLEEFPDRDKYKKKVSDMKLLTSIYKEYKKRELTKEELRFLYEIDSKIDGFGYEKDPRINEIINERNWKRDLSKVFDCSEDEISNNENDVLNGKNILYFYGNLDLSDLKNTKSLTLPQRIGGSLYLNSLESAEGLILPQTIGDSLYLSSLINAEGLTLPQMIGGNLALSRLINAEGLTLPQMIGGNLALSRLINAEGLILPQRIDGYLDLSSLISAEGLILPQIIDGSLDLSRLTTAKNLTLPQRIDSYLVLSSLESAGGLVVPKNFCYGCFVSRYITMQDLIDKSLENSEIRGKQKGFSKISILIIINLLIVLLVILGIYIF